MVLRYVVNIGTRTTPQSQPILGQTQVKNLAGGYVYQIDDWKRLDRFLILGIDGGTYYIGERELARDNAEVVLRCVASDGRRTLQRIVEISEAGRAPKNDPALFALALAAAHGDEETRRFAMDNLPCVARTGTHLFHFLHFLKQFRGNGRVVRRGVRAWYEKRPTEALTYQALKYQQRDGWSHRDVLRLRHLKPTDESRAGLYTWLAKGWPGIGDEPHPDPALRLIWAFEQAKRTTDKTEMVSLIRDYRLPREAVPTQWLKEPEVWEALLDDMPMTAMIRNLPTMTRCGLVAPMSNAANCVVERLNDAQRLKSARVHPVSLLFALKTYEAGRNDHGALWNPVSQVVDALNDAFYLSFVNAPATGKRWLLAVDASGSMTASLYAPSKDAKTGLNRNTALPISAREGALAMAVVTAHTEPHHVILGFTQGDHVKPLPISSRQRIPDAMNMFARMVEPKGTDCSLPILWALKNHQQVDAFVIYTDNESWAGPIHASQALDQYRQKTGIPARLVIVGMTATQSSLARSSDPGSLDVVGFDPSVPEIMAQFVDDFN